MGWPPLPFVCQLSVNHGDREGPSLYAFSQQLSRSSVRGQPALASEDCRTAAPLQERLHPVWLLEFSQGLSIHPADKPISATVL